MHISNRSFLVDEGCGVQATIIHILSGIACYVMIFKEEEMTPQ